VRAQGGKAAPRGFFVGFGGEAAQNDKTLKNQLLIIFSQHAYIALS
jgi:hypothetical protein